MNGKLLLASALLSLSSAGLGCIEPVRPEPRPIPVGPPRSGYNVHCPQDDKWWHWRPDDPKGWYWEDEQGQKHYGQPPCINQAQQPQNVPNNREDLGLVADANGNVSPIMWVTYHQSGGESKYNVDDKIDLVAAAEAAWPWPFDTDAELLEAIGVENIDYTRVLLDDGQPDPVLVGFYHIRIGDAIDMLWQMGITEVTTSHEGKQYTARLNGIPPEGYDRALIYDENDKLVFEIKLR